VLVMGAPLLLLVATRYRGLGTVHPWLLGFAAVMSLVPTFFLGRYQASEESPSGLILIGFLVFLVWVAAFPTVLDKLDERFHISLFPPQARVRSLSPEQRDMDARYRVLLVRLWMATLVMLVVGGSLAAVLCLLALLVRRRWTAAIAGVVCLLETVVSVHGISISLTFDPLDILAGLLAAAQWLDAVKNPLWTRWTRVEVW
jgi:hypothetical protein